MGRPAESQDAASRRRKVAPGDMTGLDPSLGTAENYLRFARQEAAGRSPDYEQLAHAVAGDALVLAFLDRLPVPKRQPNLLFAASRFLLGSPADPVSLHTLVESRPDDLAQVMTERRTQTNEAARCAILLPALASLPQPLALLEVGASAGLTLLPDVYSYDYGGHRVTGTDRDAPTFSCRPSGPIPLPTQVPEVVWRAGIDLNPLDVSSEEDVGWLSCLVWPGQPDRAERLRGAVEAARRHRPPVHHGDLLDDLARVAAGAPNGATLVVYHSAVLAYVDAARRRRFAEAVADLGAIWLSNEGPAVLEISGAGEAQRPAGGAGGASGAGAPRGGAGGEGGGAQPGFVLVRGGSDLLAHSDPHGSWLHWVG